MAGVSSVLLVALGMRLAMPALLGRFVDDAIAQRDPSRLTRTALAYVLLAVLAEGLSLLVTWGSVGISWRAGNRLRERLAARAVRLEMAWHGRHSPGQLIERIDGDVEAIAVFFTNVLVQVLGNAVLIAAMLVVATIIDPWAGLVLAAGALAGTTLLIRLRVAAVPAREAEREANAILYGDLEERLGGLEDLRVNGAGGYAVHRLHRNSARSWAAARRASLLSDGAYVTSAAAFAACSVGTLALGFALHRRGLVTVGQVVTLYRYSEMMRQPLERIAEQLKELHKALAGARRAAVVLATEPEIGEGAIRRIDFGHGPVAVELDHVSFAYGPGSPGVLHDVTLRLAPGTHLGIVGRTGSGKTSISRLLLRLWDTTSGAVRLDGVDVRDLSFEALRHRVAVVTQDVELLRASVRDNVTMLGTLPGTDHELVDLLERVGLGPWLAAQPEGLDTVLQGGDALSAGEAQLLATVRAFLADPGLVILDEASSRLDPVTEARAAAAVAELLQGRTAVLVAHRLATLEQCDEILVLDHGRLVEHGARTELAAEETSRYAALLRVASSGVLLDEVLP
jgi:ABC-type multidrug transport system fused ATPase/permease subunit